MMCLMLPGVVNPEGSGSHSRVLSRRGTGSLWLLAWNLTIRVKKRSRESSEEEMFKSRRKPMAPARAVVGKGCEKDRLTHQMWDGRGKRGVKDDAGFWLEPQKMGLPAINSDGRAQGGSG